MPVTTGKGKGSTSRKPDGPLTVEQRNAVLTAWLARHPRPVSFVWLKWPGLVRRALRFGHDEEDVNAAALLGGVEAARLFDPSRGVRFHSYAGARIRQAVQRLIRVDSRDEDRRGGGRVAPLDAATDDGSTWAESVPDPKADGTAAESGRAGELADRVAAAIRSRLPTERQRKVVAMRWGLDGGGGMTLKAVGDSFDISKERIRQIENKALAKLMDELEAVYLDHCV